MYDLKSYQMLSADDIVPVYQMGKVGSSSVCKSLEKVGIDAPHIHSLYTTRGYQLFYKFLLSQKNYPLHKKIICFLFFLWYRLKLRRRKHLKMITLVREPISVNISSFFCNLSTIAYELEQQNVATLEEAFFDKFNHDYVLDWFDIEFLPAIGLDIYKYDFDKEAGYTVIEEGNIECLVIKLEKLNGLESVIADFVDNKDFKLKNYNISENKWFKPIYQEFKKNVKFSSEYINRVYSSKLMRHFYSDKEISDFKSKFLKME